MMKKRDEPEEEEWRFWKTEDDEDQQTEAIYY